ncbi:SOS response-associated peptidase [Azospirillum agricola]|uniref:SOS response-associated peptidase n=1 Tax=Azospirillum agricola TaxID=1720247 RepID=UPI000A1CDAD7|nr:SOS response-associated peptidase [Azospirillum agricola]
MLLTTPVSELQRIFGVPDKPNLKARWNVAPTQDIPIVREEEDGRRLALARWGLVPHWAADPAIGARMINARAESAAEKPAFREALRRRRCLVPLDGFYEWTAAGPRRQGHVIRRRDRAPFALAGLWEIWRGPKGGPPPERPLESVTIVTTTANATLSALHERMPVVLDPADWERWLDPAAPLPAVQALLRPAPDDWLEVAVVGPRVNSVRNDDPSCLDPPSPQPPDGPSRRKAADDQPTLF